MKYKSVLGFLVLGIIVIGGISIIQTQKVPAKEQVANAPAAGSTRIRVVNGYCVYESRAWFLASWRIEGIQPYDTGVGACPGLPGFNYTNY
ncbi:MAG: hypothetical protein KBB91_02645 [Candidatus Pacebacteria bacterium]|nr:hypothetical protein [Candidatus Paceibacterota bacterium]MBP9701214.1 hypothetical protein [Candidatus Paceibacterota bacterium]